MTSSDLIIFTVKCIIILMEQKPYSHKQNDRHFICLEPIISEVW